MTTTTVDTQVTATSPVGAARGRVAAATASGRSAWQALVAERRARRAFRAQERAFGSLCGAERGDVLAMARRSA